MEKYIALLRGINVGGHKKILMADLKTLLSASDLNNVLTYIQSGNIVFSCSQLIPNSELEAKIESAILQHYGFEVPTIVMKHSELQTIINNYPYALGDDLKKHLITYTKDSISTENKNKLLSYNFNPDRFEVANKAVYLYCNTAYHKSKMSNNFFEKQLNTKATTRNWTTSLKLLEMSRL